MSWISRFFAAYEDRTAAIREMTVVHGDLVSALVGRPLHDAPDEEPLRDESLEGFLAWLDLHITDERADQNRAFLHEARVHVASGEIDPWGTGETPQAILLEFGVPEKFWH